MDEAALEASLPSTLANGAGKLRDYQRQGVTWLLFNWHRARSSLLADEMGLGKTLQTVAFCAQLHEKHGVRGPFLVVAPLSTLPHWQREFQRWSCLDAVRGERRRECALPVHGQNAVNCRRISWLLAGPVERACLSCVRVSESLRCSIAHQLTVCLCRRWAILQVVYAGDAEDRAAFRKHEMGPKSASRPGSHLQVRSAGYCSEKCLRASSAFPSTFVFPLLQFTLLLQFRKRGL